jgi:hypothetical protein
MKLLAQLENTSYNYEKNVFLAISILLHSIIKKQLIINFSFLQFII